jgi:hypothetical protein
LKKRKLITLLYMWLFTVSITTTVIPCSVINIFGLLGEVKAATVSENRFSVTSLIKAKFLAVKRYIRGSNKYNYWYILLMIILYIRFTSYVFRLPRSNTIVSLKVRLDN